MSLNKSKHYEGLTSQEIADLKVLQNWARNQASEAEIAEVLNHLSGKIVNLYRDKYADSLVWILDWNISSWNQVSEALARFWTDAANDSHFSPLKKSA